MFSGSVCRYFSCFEFKELKKRRLGISLTSKRNDIEVQTNVILFVDDSSFCAVRVECEIKMQVIVDYHTNMHKAVEKRFKMIRL